MQILLIVIIKEANEEGGKKKNEIKTWSRKVIIGALRKESL